MQTEDKQNITVKIIEHRSTSTKGGNAPLSVSLPLCIDRSLEPFVRCAGEEIQATISEYCNKYQDFNEIPVGGYLAMASLDIAYRYQRLKQQNDYQSLNSDINKLNAMAEKIIDEYWHV